MNVDILCDNNNNVFKGKAQVLNDAIEAIILMNEGNQCGHTNIVCKRQANINNEASVLMNECIHCGPTNIVYSKGKLICSGFFIFINEGNQCGYNTYVSSRKASFSKYGSVLMNV